ncbi:hypothetical protein COOONC_13252 [Cooperia oncophora]
MLRQQFDSLPQPDPKEYVVSADPSNTFKNRYTNVPCLDSSRILLEFLLFEGWWRLYSCKSCDVSTVTKRVYSYAGPFTQNDTRVLEDGLAGKG